MTDNLVDRLMSVVKEAKSDGKITADEYNILKQLSFDAAEYAITLEEAEKDGVIDANEKATLDLLKEKLMSNAEKIAEADGTVSEDELRLLTKISKALKPKDS